MFSSDTMPAVPDLTAVDPDQPEPLALQAERILRRAIESGEWPHGTRRLPNEIELARLLGVSRGTVRQALAVLRREGLLTSWPRRGTFVVQRKP